jgi:hypothetical protein
MRTCRCAPDAALSCASRSSPVTDYKGWEQFRLEAAEAKTVAMIIPTVGGRIVSYGRGENILFDNPDYRGKTLENTAPEARPRATRATTSTSGRSSDASRRT